MSIDISSLIGKKAPDFSVKIDTGDIVNLSSYVGKWLVLYFYPKDDTPGCTTEAIEFTQAITEFDALDAVVVGVSKDSVASHCDFKSKHQLDVILLSDESGDMVNAYGVWKQKSMMGKTFMGIERTTFLVDPSGVVRRVWPKVSVKGHVQAVLSALKACVSGA